MSTKILKDTIKAATNGTVQCSFLSDNKLVKGFIEESFFQDVLGKANAPTRQKLEIASHNTDYLETIAKEQLTNGKDTIIIR